GCSENACRGAPEWRCKLRDHTSERLARLGLDYGPRRGNSVRNDNGGAVRFAAVTVAIANGDVHLVRAGRGVEMAGNDREVLRPQLLNRGIGQLTVAPTDLSRVSAAGSICRVSELRDANRVTLLTG